MMYGFDMERALRAMRAELTNHGVQELRTPEEVDAVLGKKRARRWSSSTQCAGAPLGRRVRASLRRSRPVPSCRTTSPPFLPGRTRKPRRGRVSTSRVLRPLRLRSGCSRRGRWSSSWSDTRSSTGAPVTLRLTSVRPSRSTVTAPVWRRPSFPHNPGDVVRLKNL